MELLKQPNPEGQSSLTDSASRAPRPQIQWHLLAFFLHLLPQLFCPITGSRYGPGRHTGKWIIKSTGTAMLGEGLEAQYCGPRGPPPCRHRHGPNCSRPSQLAAWTCPASVFWTAGQLLVFLPYVCTCRSLSLQCQLGPGTGGKETRF